MGLLTSIQCKIDAIILIVIAPKKILFYDRWFVSRGKRHPTMIIKEFSLQPKEVFLFLSCASGNVVA